MRSRIHILVVEDDMAQRLLLTIWLKQEGYQVEGVDNGLDARSFLHEHWVDLIILDWDIPGMAGDQLLNLLRRRARIQIPVLFQTVHCDDADCVHILDLGADDFLVKPFSRDVLLARVRALLRRGQGADAPGRKPMPIGACTLDAAAQAVTGTGATVKLGNKEFAILWQLASRSGTPVSRQQLLAAVWGMENGTETRLVDMYVSRLRASLRALADPGWEIQSVYGQGYRLNVDGACAPLAEPILEEPKS
ncbi:response regulator transcription factor [Pseudoduganella lutea]|nr:response regulator transcription factor [Pseudoduganella lutea]